MSKATHLNGFTIAVFCPQCGTLRSKVVDSRPATDGKSVRRRRECANGHRFTTREREATE